MLRNSTLAAAVGKAAGCLLLVACLLLAACATNPVSGSPEIMLYSQAEEMAMGRKAHPEVLAKFGYYDNRKIQDYVTAVGQRVSRQCERRIPYHFTVIDAAVINAFALPGGYVYVSRGLLAECNNEAQLAGVLGHELGHVNARHNMKRLQAQLGMNILSAAVGAATGSSVWQNFSNTLLTLVGQKYSRDQERQADQLGTRYAAKAGYDPREMSRFLQRLQELHREEPRGLEAIMASHPLTSERVQRTYELARHLLEVYPQAREIGHEVYLQAIDGMLVGPGRRAGFVRRGVYYNTYCRLKLKLPSEVHSRPVNNGLYLTAGRQTKLIFLYRRQEKYLPPAVIADNFMARYGGRVLEEKPLSIQQVGGISRLYGLRDRYGREERIRVTVFTRTEFVYLFLAPAPATRAADFLPRHLAFLTPAEAAAITLPRLRLYRVRPGDTLHRIAARQLHDRDQAAALAGYNGLSGRFGLDQQLPVNLLLKIIPDYTHEASRDSSSRSRQPSSIIASVLPKTLRSGSCSGVTTWKNPSFQVSSS